MSRRERPASGSRSKLTGDFQFAGIDDGSGALKGILANIGISLLAPGTYTVNAMLANANGNRITSSNLQTLTLHAGPSNIALAFPGSEILQSGKDGPYKVVNLVIRGWQEEGFPLVGTITGFTFGQFQ